MDQQQIKKATLKKKYFIFFFSLLGLLFITEIYLRSYWGFCDSVLMMENDNYEYIAQPGQDRFRFRNHVKYNAFSMRSPEPDTSASIILGFGDSVINGGVSVDNDSLATSLLTLMLTRPDKKVQVLNISAGSWGPDNCFAYLKEKGNFNAKMMFLVVSSHDAHDNMDFDKVVDKAIRYESKQYKMATTELFSKYVFPKIFKNENPGVDIYKKAPSFNSGFLNLSDYCKNKGIPFFVYLHPDRSEYLEKKFNWQGQEIINFCKSHNIDFYSQSFSSVKLSDYSGGIHFNEQGQRHMADDLYPIINTYLEKGCN